MNGFDTGRIATRLPSLWSGLSRVAIASAPPRWLFERLPGYALFRSLTQRLAGGAEGAPGSRHSSRSKRRLVRAFIIAELEDGRVTVFVPSVPTPFAGAVYILNRERVHSLDVPFTQAIRSISRWGSGSKDLVAAMTQAEQ